MGPDACHIEIAHPRPTPRWPSACARDASIATSKKKSTNTSRIFIKMCHGLDARFAFCGDRTEESAQEPSNSSHVTLRHVQAGVGCGIVFAGPTVRLREQQQEPSEKRSTSRVCECACVGPPSMRAYANPNTQLIVQCSTPFCFLSQPNPDPTHI